MHKMGGNCKDTSIHEYSPAFLMVMTGWRSEFTHYSAAPTLLGKDRCTMRLLDSGYQSNCCGLGHKARTRDILLWLMTGDTCKICDLWRSCPCWSSTRRGISCVLIPAESCRNEHRRDSSLSHRPCSRELPWTAALCDTFFTGQFSASDRGHVLKCRQVWMKLKHSVFLATAQTSVF